MEQGAFFEGMGLDLWLFDRELKGGRINPQATFVRQ